MVVDPRAGQGAGIGGFKPASEIGDALEAGHPTYFIGFSAEPEPGQQYLDVVEGQVRFLERVTTLHPHSPRPSAIGNCQAGYQTLMAEMLRPDLFGPCLVVGSPMSYWQGQHHKAPMRYAGGLIGGSWATAMISDIGNGKFDGTWLILNFDLLNPANFFWTKQYEVYANVDAGAQRYLSFEKWWGDFIKMDGEEIQYLVDNLFIGNKLTRNELAAHDGTIFDIRNIKSPIIVLTSSGDNISPPPQALGWILDLYHDIDEIRAAGQVIVYAVDLQAGHLGLFVSSKVAKKEDEEFVLTIDAIERLQPGLYEMVISPASPNSGAAPWAASEWRVAFEPRVLNDVRAFGRNSGDDDRAFDAVAKLSNLNLAAYRALVQPSMRAVVNDTLAEFWRKLNPLRLSYTLFSDINPWMAGVAVLAPWVVESRLPITDDNPLLATQNSISDAIAQSFDSYRDFRDQIIEAWFFSFYGSPLLQELLAEKSSNHTPRGAFAS